MNTEENETSIEIPKLLEQHESEADSDMLIKQDQHLKRCINYLNSHISMYST